MTSPLFEFGSAHFSAYTKSAIYRRYAYFCDHLGEPYDGMPKCAETALLRMLNLYGEEDWVRQMFDGMEDDERCYATALVASMEVNRSIMRGFVAACDSEKLDADTVFVRFIERLPPPRFLSAERNTRKLIEQLLYLVPAIGLSDAPAHGRTLEADFSKVQCTFTMLIECGVKLQRIPLSSECIGALVQGELARGNQMSILKAGWCRQDVPFDMQSVDFSAIGLDHTKTVLREAKSVGVDAALLEAYIAQPCGKRKRSVHTRGL